jgi:hypothetical protein
VQACGDAHLLNFGGFATIQSDCIRLLSIVLEVSQAGQFVKDPLDQLRNGILEQK